MCISDILFFIFFESANSEPKMHSARERADDTKGETQKDSGQPRHTTKQAQKQLLLSKSKTNAKGQKKHTHPAHCR